MLVLSRKSNESIHISDEIVVTVLSIRGQKVRLGIAAPGRVQVHRSELRLIQAPHEQPAASTLPLPEPTTTVPSTTPAGALLFRCPRPPTDGVESA